jgi:hypothetical protein
MSLLQEAAADPTRRHLAGNVKSPESLLVPEVLERLAAEHGERLVTRRLHELELARATGPVDEEEVSLGNRRMTAVGSSPIARGCTLRELGPV